MVITLQPILTETPMTPPGVRTDCLLPEEVGGEVCVAVAGAVGDALALVIVGVGAAVDSTPPVRTWIGYTACQEY